jgi:hypothetical protein
MSLTFLGKHLLIRQSCGLLLRNSDREASICFGGTTIPFGDQMVRRGLGRRDLPITGGNDGSNPFNRYIGGILSVPGKLCGLPRCTVWGLTVRVAEGATDSFGGGVGGLVFRICGL